MRGSFFAYLSPDVISACYCLSAPWVHRFAGRRWLWSVAAAVLVVLAGLLVAQAHAGVPIALSCAFRVGMLSLVPAYALELGASAAAAQVMTRYQWSAWLQTPLSLLAGVGAFIPGLWVGGAVYTLAGWLVPSATCR
jgi:uncharacterized membrane protein